MDSNHTVNPHFPHHLYSTLQVDVIPCMVDRICADVTVTGMDAARGMINVAAEDHTGSIVLLSDPYEVRRGMRLKMRGGAAASIPAGVRAVSQLPGKAKASNKGSPLVKFTK